MKNENHKLKDLPSKEKKQKKEELNKQFREATQGLTASELYYKAIAFWKEGKYTDPDKALKFLNKAIELYPRFAEAYYSRGLAYAKRKGNYDQAISDFSKAIELDPRNAGSYAYRGAAYAKGKGNYDRAISDFSKAIELDPRNARFYYDRGLTWFKKGDDNRACANWRKACELGKCGGLNWAKSQGRCQ